MILVRASITGLCLNGVRVFENACLCSVFCSAFESERVRTPCSGLNVFGSEAFHVLFEFGLSCSCFVRCSAGRWLLVQDLGSWILDLGSWILDLGSWILDLGSLIKEGVYHEARVSFLSLRLVRLP